MTPTPTATEQHWTTPDGTQLAGTLQLPNPPSEAPRPAVLLISGSGPLDRNSNTDAQSLNIASAIAEHLATLGIASLRFDKRGTGASGGDYATTGFNDETDDAATALHHLANLEGIDAGHIAVIGHSAGATIGIRLAASEPAPTDAPSASVLDWIPKFELSPRTEIEDELEQAQQALDRARAALDQARSEGTLPPEDLRALDRRLESYGPHAPELTDAPGPELPPRQYHHILPEPPRSL